MTPDQDQVDWVNAWLAKHPHAKPGRIRRVTAPLRTNVETASYSDYTRFFESFKWQFPPQIATYAEWAQMLAEQ